MHMGFWWGDENGPVKNSLYDQVIIRPKIRTENFCNYTSS